MTAYWTFNEACQQLRCSRNTLKAMIADGRVEAVDRRKPGASTPSGSSSPTAYKMWPMLNSLTSNGGPDYENIHAPL